MVNNKFLNFTKETPNDSSEWGIYIVRKELDLSREVWVVKNNLASKIIATSDYYEIQNIDKLFEDLNKDITLKFEDIYSKLEEYYNNVEPLSIRKTYNTFQEMQEDESPIDDVTKNPLFYGNLVAVIKDSDSSKNGIYMYKKPGWLYVQKLGDLSDMVTKSTDQTIKSTKTFDKSPKVPIANEEKDAVPLEQLESIGKWVTSDYWLLAIVDLKEQVLWGIKTNGEVYQAIGIPEDVKNVLNKIELNLDNIEKLISNKVDKVDTKSLIDEVFANCSYSTISNEYSYVITDDENRILLAIDCSGVIHIPNKYISEIIKDNEDRIQLLLDEEDRIINERDKDGLLYEHVGINTPLIKSKHIDTNILEVNEKIDFKKGSLDELKKDLILSGFKSGNSDWSLDEYIELPMPRVAAKVNFISSRPMPTTKTQDVPAELEYFDKEGNYFKKPIIWNCQGNSSMGYQKKNFKFDIEDGSSIKIGNWVSQDSFHLKAYYIDFFRGQNNVCYNLCEQFYQTRDIKDRRPWSYITNKYVDEFSDSGILRDNFETGALAHPDGFPIMVYHNGEFYGLYTWNLKKHRDNYFLDKKAPENIMLDGTLSTATIWNGNIDWTAFEIKNPKSLKTLDGGKYDGDNPTEISNNDAHSVKVKGYIERLSKAMSLINSNKTKQMFEKFFNVPFFIDYFIEAQITYNSDGFAKNWIWCSWDGYIWTPTFYDQDSVFGMHWRGTYVTKESIDRELGTNKMLPSGLLFEMYKEDINIRYKELRDKGVISVANIVNLFQDWTQRVGYDNYKKELNKWNETPSFRTNNTVEEWELIAETEYDANYDINKEYNIGDTCIYRTGGLNHKFKALIKNKGIIPVEDNYTLFPKIGGFFNSVLRIEKWLEKKIEMCDKMFNYK